MFGSVRIKKIHPCPNIDWFSGPQPCPSAACLKGCYCSTQTAQQPQLLALASVQEKEGIEEVVVETLHKLFKVGQGKGEFNRRYNTIMGVRETSAFEARGYDRGTGSRLFHPEEVSISSGIKVS